MLIAFAPGTAQADPDDAGSPPPEGDGATCDWFWYTLEPPGIAVRPECLAAFP